TTEDTEEYKGKRDRNSPSLASYRYDSDLGMLKRGKTHGKSGANRSNQTILMLGKPIMNLLRALLFAIAVMSFGVVHAQEARTPVCPRDDKDFVAIQQRAEANDPTAQTALASCYDLGMHVQPNGKELIR